MSEPRRIAIAGSTGSIGRQALDVVRSAPERFEVVALGASSSVDLLADQAAEFRPPVVAIADEARREELSTRLPAGIEVLSGRDSLALLGSSAEADTVLNGVVGFAGLLVTVSALEEGRRLALANKESLIAGAPVVQRARRTPGAEIVPVDSEHCAIYQCLAGARAEDPSNAPRSIERLVLTASGGPFRNRTLAELGSVTVEDALAHPTWSMGPKVTIDSSTLMNKGLEVLEARELFGVSVDEVAVVVHPQSIVHSMVTFSDGSTIAQLSAPDMRLPIGYCLGYPDRLEHAFGQLDWSSPLVLDFEAPDLETFSCLRLAFEAGRAGEAAPAWLNAANEVAVAAFLEGRIRWVQIAEVVADTLSRFRATSLETIEDVLAADGAARDVARQAVSARSEAA